MNIRLQVVLMAIWAALFALLAHMMRKKKIDVRYVLPWLLLDAVLILLTAFPAILGRMAAFLGIELPSNMLFFFGMIFLTAIIFSMSVTISRLANAVKELAQRIAIDENSERKAAEGG